MDTEVGHNQRMSNTIGRHPVTLRVGTHLIFPLSTQAADLYISCNLDSQSRLDFESTCLLVREEVWDWQEVLLRGGVGAVVVCLCCPLEKELTGSAGETRGANVKI